MRIPRILPAAVGALILCFGVLSPARAADPSFTDVIDSTGMSYTGSTEGDGAVFTYKGEQVVLLSQHGGRAWKGYFIGKRVASVAFTLPVQDRHGCIAADLAGLDAGGGLVGPDGKDDLFCQVGACRGTCTKAYPKELWIQTPSGFIDKAAVARVDDPHARGRDSASFKLPDGTFVLATANEASTLYPALSVHKAYHVSEGRFTPIPLAGIKPVQSPFQCVVAVPNGAGFPDLLYCQNNRITAYRYVSGTYKVTSAYPPIAARDLTVYGKQVVATTKTGLFILRSAGWAKIATLVDGARLTTGDMNCDSRRDIIVTQAKGAGNKHILFLDTGSGAYRKVPLPPGRGANGDTPTYIPNWDGQGYAAVAITNGMWGTGTNQWITSSCAR